VTPGLVFWAFLASTQLCKGIVSVSEMGHPWSGFLLPVIGSSLETFWAVRKCGLLWAVLAAGVFTCSNLFLVQVSVFEQKSYFTDLPMAGFVYFCMGCWQRKQRSKDSLLNGDMNSSNLVCCIIILYV